MRIPGHPEDSNKIKVEQSKTRVGLMGMVGLYYFVGSRPAAVFLDYKVDSAEFYDQRAFARPGPFALSLSTRF